jgi:RNA polymerase sigma-70 factor (ECF subfamily)
MTERWFEDEMREILPALYGTALRLAKNPADAEDLVAEAAARAWIARDTLKERAAFRGWVFRILSNAFLSDCRASAARPEEESLDEAVGAGVDGFSLFERLHQPFLLWWSNPEREFLDRLLRDDLERAIDALPEGYRLVVVLADVQGLAYREIATVLDIPIGTVRSRLARARGLLQRRLWEQGRDAGLVRGQPAPQVGTS